MLSSNSLESVFTLRYRSPSKEGDEILTATLVDAADPTKPGKRVLVRVFPVAIGVQTCIHPTHALYRNNILWLLFVSGLVLG